MQLAKTTTIVLGLLVALATLAGANAIQFSYSDVSSSPFDLTGGYGSVMMNQPGQYQYGMTWTPDTVAGGWSAQRSSGSFGYSDSYGLTSASVRSPSISGSYSHGYGGSYGGFQAGTTYAMPWGTTGFGQQWTSGYSPYATSAWSTGYNTWHY